MPHRVWVETFTGLRVGQFEHLLAVMGARDNGSTGIGRPWCLPLGKRVLLVGAYYRTNLSMRQLNVLFGVSLATVSRVVRRLGPLLALEPTERPMRTVPARLWHVDGTLVPVGALSVRPSQRPYQLSRRQLVIVKTSTRLALAEPCPAPGASGPPSK
ncbi:helix-turn-helix domain-containing protein [Streptomyces sp. NPDC002537]